jgi:hypothetical protein
MPTGSSAREMGIQTFGVDEDAEQAPGADAVDAACLFVRHSPRGSGAAFGLSHPTMELFGILFAIPVTLVTSLVYVALIAAARRWPRIKLALLLFSGCVGVCVAAEVLALGIWGAKGAYGHLRHAFTLVHFLNCLLAPPAVAHVVLHWGARATSRGWLQLVMVVPCCWFACMASIMWGIGIDEAIVGPDAGKPFYMTRASRPNKRDRGDGGIPVLFHTARAWPAAPHHER